eukprot:scaffold22269_cov44-Phaeocystis_antarctica.AAC.1
MGVRAYTRNLESASMYYNVMYSHAKQTGAIISMIFLRALCTSREGTYGKQLTLSLTVSKRMTLEP